FRIAADPSHTLAARLGSRNVERGPSRVNARYLKAAIGEKLCERACSASDVQHATRTELLRNGDVHIEVAPIGVERVIDGGQPRVLEYGISHADNSTKWWPSQFPGRSSDGFREAQTGAARSERISRSRKMLRGDRSLPLLQLDARSQAVPRQGALLPTRACLRPGGRRRSAGCRDSAGRPQTAARKRRHQRGGFRLQHHAGRWRVLA